MKVAPLARSPELNVADLIVCTVESLLVQVTVVPFLTVSEEGLKAKFWMLMLFVATGASCVVVDVGAGVGFVTGAELLFVLPDTPYGVF